MSTYHPMSAASALATARHDAVHSRFRRHFLFVGRTNLPYAATDPAAEALVAAAWSTWPQTLAGVRAILERYPSETSPACLADAPPLIHLSAEDRDRVRTWADQAFKASTDVAQTCASLLARLATVRLECEVIDGLQTPVDKHAAMAMLWPAMTDLCNDIEALPQGIWIP